MKHNHLGNEIWARSCAKKRTINRSPVHRVRSRWTATGTSTSLGTDQRAEHRYVAAKFTASGDRLWISAPIADVAGGHEFAAVEVSESGDVWLTGTLVGGEDRDWLTAKYDSDGELEWHRTNGTSTNVEEAADLVVGADGTILVAGTRSILHFNGSRTTGIEVLTFDAAGNTVGSPLRHDGPRFSDDRPLRILRQGSTSVHVLGEETFAIV